MELSMNWEGYRIQEIEKIHSNLRKIQNKKPIWYAIHYFLVEVLYYNKSERVFSTRFSKYLISKKFNLSGWR